MENRIRVKEIKKRFENLDNHLIEKPQCLNSTRLKSSTLFNGNGQNNLAIRNVKQVNQLETNKSQVKRTPAFRTPKYSLPNLRPCLQKEDFKSNKSETESQLFVALTDTLKKKLEAPLPKGPAPRKPPRTFAHPLNLTSPAKSPLSQQSTSEAMDRPTLIRSKTEPHIMLKKIESALLGNQQEMNRPNNKPKPSPRQNVNYAQQNYGNFHVYDTPCNSDNQQQSKKGDNNCFPMLTSCTKSDPVYTEPYIRPTNGKVQKFDATSSSPSEPKALHYLSSPIMIDNQVNTPANSYEDLLLKKIQMSMFESLNNNTKSETDSDGDSVKDINRHMVEERKIYAKRVASVKKVSYRRKNYGSSNLIDALLLIGIDNDINNGHVAYIQSKFPADANIPDNFACLIFPDADNWPLAPPPDHLPESSRHNNYTIFITAADGTRSYAYCRRIQPEGSSVCLPLAYAILTRHKANNLYYKILKLIETRHGIPKLEFNTFLNSLQEARFPSKQDSLRIGDINMTNKEVWQDSHDISNLLQIISVPIFIQLLSSLLLERKIILVGSFISILSDSIEGLLKSLYPFEWQHTIISLLPFSMSELLQAPTPYIVGLLKKKKESISNDFFSDIDDVIVVDVDSGTVIKKRGDEGSVIPDRLAKALKEALYMAPVHSTDAAPSEALISLFVNLVGHYDNHFTTNNPQPVSISDRNKMFQKEKFIKAPSTRSVRLFLEWFTETALFQTFIQERIKKPNLMGSFEIKSIEYSRLLALKEKGLLKGRGLKGLKEWATHSS